MSKVDKHKRQIIADMLRKSDGPLSISKIMHTLQLGSIDVIYHCEAMTVLGLIEKLNMNGNIYYVWSRSGEKL